MKTVKNPMPKVEFEGRTYSLTSRKTAVPNLSEMSRLEAGIWLNRHTRAQGYFKPDNPMIGYGGTVN